MYDRRWVLSVQQRMRITAGGSLAVREVEHLLHEADQGDGSTLRPGYALMQKLYLMAVETARTGRLDPDVEAWMESMATLEPRPSPIAKPGSSAR